MRWIYWIALFFFFGGIYLALGFIGVIEFPLVPKTQSPEPSNREKGEVVLRPEKISMNRNATLEDPFSPPNVDPPLRKDGSKRLAKIWSAMDVEALVKILEKWEDSDALPVLAKMEDKKLAELLSQLPPERAAILSKGIKSMTKGGQP